MTTFDTEIDSIGVVADDAARLLAAYEAGSSFFFSAPHSVLLARGVAATVPKTHCAREELPRRVSDFLYSATEFGRRNPIVVGAVPFGGSLPAHLVMPEEVVRAAPLNVVVPQAPRSRAPDCAVRSVPTPAEYERSVSRVLRRMADGELSKVVLARSLELTAGGPVDVRGMLRNLALADPASYTFAVDLPRRGEDGTRDSFGPQPRLQRTFLGASPELLVSRRGTQVRSNPMAGSRPRSADPVEDRRLAAELSTSDKDHREHAAVVDAVVQALRPFCGNLGVPAPSVVGTGAMWHLATEITGELRDPATSSLELADALHPTPAVCGTPVQRAREVIAETEPFERGYYAGMVGWCDAAGDGEWVVAIRCADIEADSLRLFAGAGILAGSDPADELAESAAKFRTALSAMGLDQVV
ncbi:isochorismate synthase DhbC [Saccharopolyspora phatthalungensis]|uniref:isochorismate synthase n=1 Tax=Saccharopolyspora phatthalungensis TaxID=664693 RepID=A0A840QGK7_9PSEU|nr:isochorismate synthase DhbC [Saccharopolyspora phatthalungensis]MBB5157888.1 isochorismate synthase [Saccharopolyspora phatthalungensis]